MAVPVVIGALTLARILGPIAARQLASRGAATATAGRAASTAARGATRAKPKPTRAQKARMKQASKERKTEAKAQGGKQGPTDVLTSAERQAAVKRAQAKASVGRYRSITTASERAQLRQIHAKGHAAKKGVQAAIDRGTARGVAAAGSTAARATAVRSTAAKIASWPTRKPVLATSLIGGATLALPTGKSGQGSAGTSGSQTVSPAIRDKDAGRVTPKINFTEKPNIGTGPTSGAATAANKPGTSTGGRGSQGKKKVKVKTPKPMQTVSQSRTMWVKRGEMVGGQEVKKGYLAQYGRAEKKVSAKVNIVTDTESGKRAGETWKYKTGKTIAKVKKKK